ncbi:glycosyltransferase family 4 protein [Paracoccaceae bacterium]|nr:glycosyltransferase family 4 protein [Paracoccaceae bacterium]
MRNEPRKILLAANTSWYLFNFRKNTIKRLVSEGYEVVCLAGDSEYGFELEKLGSKIETVKLNNVSVNPFYELVSFASILKRIFLLRPSVVLSFTPKVVMYSSVCSFLNRIPYVINVSGQGTANSFSGISRKIYIVLFGFVCRFASKIFCQNSDDFDKVQTLFSVDIEKLELLAGSGIPLDEFKYSQPKNRGIIKIGLFCRLIEEKGVRIFLDVIESMQNVECISFKLAGKIDSDRTNAVTELEIMRVERLKNFKFLGFLEDCREEIRDCDCVVLPSFYSEGTPRVLLEALALGRPVITTRTPGCRDTVKNNGYLIAPKSAEDLSSAIDKFLDLSIAERLIMGLNSRKLAELRFDETKIINSYLVVITDILNRKVR